MHAPTASSTRPIRVRLHDGRWVSIRPIEPSDAVALSGFYARLSPESRRRRFLGGRSGATPDVVRAFLAPAADGVVAVAEAGGELLGHACLLTVADDGAEAAFAVADDHQGQGLGRALVRAAIERARGRGLRRMTATMLAGNEPMRHLLRTAGAVVVAERSAGGVTEIVLEL